MFPPSSGLDVYIIDIMNQILIYSLAYALYFDHKRRHDPEFRKSLKRESRRSERAAKEEQAAQGAKQREAIKAAYLEAQEEGFPTDDKEKEAYFMTEVAKGEQLVQDGISRLQF